MKSLWHFFRLIRPLNLAVIALTMGVFQIFLSTYQNTWLPNFHDQTFQNGIGGMVLLEVPDWGKILVQHDFLLLVLSTVLIAAAGNIINDYFDVKADRVNKPELLIIDKYIKRRWAIVFNWIFNSTGLLIALYLSWKLKNLYVVIVPFTAINLLWFYSMYFKRKFLAGNILVAFLTALVPIYVLISYLPVHPIILGDQNNIRTLSAALILKPVLMISTVAFLINLIREIIKDIADVEGDLLLNAQTIPIRWGIKRAKWVLFALLIPLLISFFVYILFCWELDFFMNGGSIGFPNYSPPIINSTKHVYFGICAILVLVLVLVNYLIMALSNQRKSYLLSSNLLKLAMFFGLLTPLFL